jgi:hypothetical protein
LGQVFARRLAGWKSGHEGARAGLGPSLRAHIWISVAEVKSQPHCNRPQVAVLRRR